MRNANFRLLDGIREFAPWNDAGEVAVRSREASGGEHRYALGLGVVRANGVAQLVCVKLVGGSDFFTAELPPADGEEAANCLSDIQKEQN